MDSHAAISAYGGTKNTEVFKLVVKGSQGHILPGPQCTPQCGNDSLYKNAVQNNIV